MADYSKAGDQPKASPKGSETIEVTDLNKSSADKVLNALKVALPSGLLLNLSEAGTLEVILRYKDRPELSNAAVAEHLTRMARIRGAARGTPPNPYVKRPTSPPLNVPQEIKQAVATKRRSQTKPLERAYVLPVQAEQAPSQKETKMPEAVQTTRNIGQELFAGVQESAIGEIFQLEPGGEIKLDVLNEALSSYDRAYGGARLQRKSVKAQLGEAMRSLPTQYKPEAEPGLKGRAKGQRWQVSRRKSGVGVGEASAICTLTVTLDDKDNLTFEGPEDLKSEIKDEFARLFDIVKGPNVSSFIDYQFMRLGSVKTGWGWFVPKAHVERARQLRYALVTAWGRWEPVLPVTSIDAFRAGIREGLSREIDALTAKCTAALNDNITPTVALNRLKEINDLDERIVSFGPMIGVGYVAGLRAELQQIRFPIEQHTTDTEQRGALIREEMGW